jgi:hypothetical protein
MMLNPFPVQDRNLAEGPKKGVGSAYEYFAARAFTFSQKEETIPNPSSG